MTSMNELINIPEHTFGEKGKNLAKLIGEVQ